MTATLHRPSDRPGRGLDAERGSAFLHAQARWLTYALAHAASPEIVDTVLRMHDASHAGWLELIAAVDHVDPDAAGQLVTLYGYYGRVAGSLERGLDRRLGAEVRRKVLTLLARHLDQLTDDAVAIVEEAASG